MVTFLSLFLGLTVGVHPVQVAVDDRVASVELLLDGRLVATRSEAPWTFDCDFGEELLPHRLEAVARDEKGGEIDRATQWINVPRPPAEATIVLSGGAGGDYDTARVGWQATDESAPRRISVQFDNEPVEAGPDGSVVLPEHEPETIHVLSAELVFSPSLTVRTDLVFGGSYAEEVQSDLSAVALMRSPGDSLPSPDEMQKWLRVNGRVEKVVAVEEPPGDIVVVRDGGSGPTLEALGRRARLAISSRPTKGVEAEDILHSGISSDDTLRFIDPSPEWVTSPRGMAVALLPASADVNEADVGLGWGVTNFFFAPQPGESERLAEAVGVAGLEAARSNRPRLVLLIRTPGRATDTFAAREVRRFLEALQVPFLYWVASERPEAADGWGKSRVVTRLRDLNQGIDEAARLIESQFIVWVAGTHLPQDFGLVGEGQQRFRIAGR